MLFWPGVGFRNPVISSPGGTILGQKGSYLVALVKLVLTLAAQRIFRGNDGSCTEVW